MKRTIAGLLMIAAAIACNDSTPTSPSPINPPVGAAAGTYTLERYNGAAIPAITATNNVGPFGVWGGKLVIGADRSYTRTIEWGNAGDTSTQVETGSFRLVDATFTFYPSNKARENGYVGELAAGAISYGAGIPNATYTFRR